ALELPLRLGLVLAARVLGPFLCVLGLLAAEPLGRRAQPATDALRLGLGRRFGFFGFGVGVVLAANEFDLRHLGAVAAAIAESKNPRVAARTRLEPRRNRVEQLAHDVAILNV